VAARGLHELQDCLAAAADDQRAVVALGAEGHREVDTAVQAATAELSGDLGEDAAPARTVRARRQTQICRGGGCGRLEQRRRSWHEVSSRRRSQMTRSMGWSGADAILSYLIDLVK
jgi:hypothetical protein